LKTNENDITLKSFINVNDGGNVNQFDVLVSYKNCYENLNYCFKIKRII
jgi:hypothetical protein